MRGKCNLTSIPMMTVLNSSSTPMRSLGAATLEAFTPSCIKQQQRQHTPSSSPAELDAHVEMGEKWKADTDLVYSSMGSDGVQNMQKCKQNGGPHMALSDREAKE
ncbi:hypothetical protein VIGAN_08368900 [Vigna angularis var. angularis]|uniref:Uncharacterized protein n=2 Tax=Phaseolus angularis TaxID=3914 RepID=A0A0S3SV81_PHAAN|nr:hypothetical protein VIGAN_08368900 [Vigna angularis var. angularis]